MTHLLSLILALITLSPATAPSTTTSPSTQPYPTSAPLSQSDQIHFAQLAIDIDPAGQPLAAYQIELTRNGNVSIVGIAGGNDPFSNPPDYDPAALSHGQLILASLTTNANPPKTTTRVAILQIAIQGDQPASYDARLIVAGNPNAQPIPAKIIVTPLIQSKGDHP